MLELSRFFGMVIYLQFKDIQHHNKPHVHVYYGDYSASVGIDGILLLTFSTGEQKLFDTTVLTESVYEPLKDYSVALNPILFHGILTWLDGSIDISPESTYELSYEYNTQDIVCA